MLSGLVVAVENGERGEQPYEVLEDYCQICVTEQAMESGDLIEYRYSNLNGDTWQSATVATVADETRLCWSLIDDDGMLRDYYKDRIEVRRMQSGTSHPNTVSDPAE